MKIPLRDRFPDRNPENVVEADEWITTLQNEIRTISFRLEEDSISGEGEIKGTDGRPWTEEERNEWRKRAKKGLVWRQNRLAELNHWLFKTNFSCPHCGRQILLHAT